MSKYSPLKEFLAGQKQDHVPMTFAEIESVLAFPLPASKQYPAWWSNNPSNNPMTKEWLAAGFETESVNTAGGKLVFRRVSDRKGPAGAHGHGGLAESLAPFSTRHPGFGFMKGLLTIEEGYDVTKPPSDEAWDEGYLGVEERK
jgi:hypothetical protein